MAYYAQEFCKITGLKPDTLRFYVDKGLIVPKVNPENQYKTYDDLDVVDMYYVRNRRAMGAPIVKINEVLTRLPRETQIEWLCAYERELEAQLAQVKMQLKQCRKAQRDLGKLPHLFTNVVDMRADESPSLYHLLLIGENASDDPARFELEERWRDLYPRMNGMIHVPRAELSGEGCAQLSVSFGVYVPEELLLHLPALRCAPVRAYPSKDRIGMVVRLRDPFAMTREDIAPLLAYAKEKNYRFADDLMGWMIAKEADHGVCYYDFALRVSVEAQEE